MNKKYREYILIAVLYLLITLLFTYPLVLNFTTHIPGNGGDGPHFLWNLWKTKDAVLNFHHLYKTNHIFYPIGTNLITHTYAPIIGILSIPLSIFLSNVTTYNTLVILAFVLNGVGAFALIKYLTHSTVPSFLGGMIFAFSPNFFGHLLGHFDMLWGGWLPLFILFFLKMMKETRVHNLIFSCIFFLATFLTSYYYAVFLALFVGLFIIFSACSTYEIVLQKSFWKPLLGFSIITTIFLSPFLTLYFREVLAHSYVNISSLHSSHFTSGDLLDFIVPSRMNKFYQYLLPDFISMFKTYRISERNIFIGYSILTMALFAVFNKRIVYPRKYLWVACFTFFTIFFFFYKLSINNSTHFNLFNADLSIPLVFGLYKKVPVLNNLRTPVRCDILVVLSIAVLSSFTINYYFHKVKHSHLKAVLTAAILVVVLLEYLPTPYPLYQLPFSPLLARIKNDPADCTVLEIPIGISDGLRNLYHDRNSTHMYHQTLHGKKMFGGYVARLPERVFRYFRREPVIMATIHLQKFPRMGGFGDSKGTGEDFVRRYGLKYVIVNKKELSNQAHENVMRWIKHTFNISESWHDRDIQLMQISGESNPGTS